MDTPESRPIAVGADGLPGSAGALRYAVHEADRRHVPLQLVHIVPGYQPPGPAVPEPVLQGLGRDVLDETTRTAQELAPDLDVRTVLDHGGRVAGLLAAAEHAQLLVVGRETRQGVDRLLMGTATGSVASRASCAVTVVPSYWTGERPHGRVVAAVKSARHAHELVGRAFAEAESRQASLLLVMAWQVPDPYFDRIEARTHAAEWESQGQEVLGNAVADWRSAFPGVSVDTRVVHGAPARVLLDASRDSDLLIISRRRHRLPPYGHLGGVGHALLRSGEVPVQVVPGAADPVEPEDLSLEASGAMLR